jgi:hypothetical protein
MNSNASWKNTTDFYGFNLYQAFSGINKKPHFMLNTYLESSKRSIEAGLVFKRDKRLLSGGSFAYKYYLINMNGLSYNKSRDKRFRPYVSYTFVYNHYGKNIDEDERVKNDIMGVESSISIEHYFGGGLQTRVVDNLFFDINGGYGFFMGNMEHGEHMLMLKYNENGKRGTGFIFKAGINYTFEYSP